MKTFIELVEIVKLADTENVNSKPKKWFIDFYDNVIDIEYYPDETNVIKESLIEQELTKEGIDRAYKFIAKRL